MNNYLKTIGKILYLPIYCAIKIESAADRVVSVMFNWAAGYDRPRENRLLLPQSTKSKLEELVTK